MDINELKSKFETIVKENINRHGIGKLMHWLEETDFFTAPASTIFHGNYAGGLLEHSLNVYKYLSSSKILKDAGYSNETIALVSLFHDVCKTNTYKVSTRNVKNEKTGQWEKQPFYKAEADFPFGHGEKSVYLIMKHIDLTDEEALAINWHMGGFDQRSTGHDMSSAYNKSKLAVELHIADMRATYIDENK